MKSSSVSVLGRIAFPLLGLGFALTYYVTTRTMSIKAVRYPHLFVQVCVLLFAWIILTEVVALRKRPQAKTSPDAADRSVLLRRGAVIGCSVAYAILMPFLGYITSTAIFLTGLIWYLGQRRPLRLIAVVGGVTLVFYVLFRLWLKMPLPDGLIG